MRNQRKCAFCGRVATLTGEHIWSDWVGRLLVPRKIRYKWTEADGTVKEWHKTGLDAKVKVVCDTCNNGWMSDLENTAKPIVQDMILDPKDVTLGPAELKIIAALAFKSAIIADHIRLNKLRFLYDAAQRRNFAQSLTVPTGVQMWISGVEAQCGILKGGDSTTGRWAATGFRINVCTYAIGHLVLQVTCTRWNKGSNRRKHAPGKLTQADEWGLVSTPFWPLPPEPVTWPPPNWMTKDSLDTFADRWKKLLIAP